LLSRKYNTVAPEMVLTQREPFTNVLDAYKTLDTRQPGWVKVELKPGAQAARQKAA
jgi:threonine dehydrogenase-like Zn-dependent dehydrogenase